MSRSPTPDSLYRRSTLELKGYRSAEKYWSEEEEPPKKLAFLRLGLPPSGYVMLIVEFIPTFLHFALTHFHISYSGFQEDPAYTYWFSFSAVVSAAPIIFIIAILSDGYVYGKLSATMLCLFLLCVTGVCTVLVTLEDVLSKTTRDVMAHIAPFSMFFFFITIPLRVTVFTDIIARTKDHRRARKAFTAFWISNLLGAAFGLALYKYVYDVGGPTTIFRLTIWLALLCLIYFAVASLITMSVPLELPFSNLFLHHLHCFVFAIKNQSKQENQQDGKNKAHWMDVALVKYTKTEVKRTRAIYHLAILAVPIACCTACVILVPQVWYQSREDHVLFDGALDDLSGFYLFLILLVLFCALIQFAFIPIMSHFNFQIKEYWFLTAGYLVLGIPLFMLLITEIQCAVSNPSRDDYSQVRIINGYDETVVVLSEWLGTNGEKRNATVLPGHVLVMSISKDRVDSNADAVIFGNDSILKDIFVLAVEPQTTRTYFMSPKILDTVLNVSEARLVKLGVYDRQGSLPTLVVTCQKKYWDDEVFFHCSLTYRGFKRYMERERLCRYEIKYVAGRRQRHIVPTILHYASSYYKCTLLSKSNGGNEFLLPVKPHDTVHLHLTDSGKSSKRDGMVESLKADGPLLLRTDMKVETCFMNDKMFHAQIVIQAFSTAVLLVDANTIYCIHGPPRLRMISFALLYGGAYLGYIVHRLIYIRSWTMITVATWHVVLYFVGFIHHLILTVLMGLEYHSWDESWRPSILWKIRLWIRNRIRYKKFLSEKGPELAEASQKRDHGILQTEVEKDKKIEDEKMTKRVTFEFIDSSPLNGNASTSELADVNSRHERKLADTQITSEERKMIYLASPEDCRYGNIVALNTRETWLPLSIYSVCIHHLTAPVRATARTLTRWLPVTSLWILNLGEGTGMFT